MMSERQIFQQIEMSNRYNTKCQTLSMRGNTWVADVGDTTRELCRYDVMPDNLSASLVTTPSGRTSVHWTLIGETHWSQSYFLHPNVGDFLVSTWKFTSCCRKR